MTEHDQIVWTAGFFDGEGTTGIGKQSRICGKVTKKTSLSYVLGVAICQKDPKPLQIIHEMFGGKLYSYQVRGVRYWRWYAWSSIALRFLETILPYSILKAERISICIDFQKSLTEWNLDYGRRGYPEFVNTAREQFFQTMKELNRRGVSSENLNPKTPGVKKGSANHLSARNGNPTSTGKEIQIVQ